MKRVLGAALLLLCAGSAHAETSEAGQRPACGGDVVRLCFSHIPDRAAIGDCMVAKRSQLSASCRAVVDAGLAEKARARSATQDTFSREMASR